MVARRNSIIPSWNAGFARSPGESAAPEQWIGLIGVWAPFLGVQGNALFDLTQFGHHGSISGGIWAQGTSSLALAHDTTTDAVNFGPLIIPVQQATVVLDYEKRDATNRASSAFGFVGSNHPERAGAHLPYSDGVVYWDFGGFDENITRESVAGLTVTGRHVWVFTAGSRGMEIWQDGILRSSNSATPTRVSSGSNYTFGTSGGVAASDLADYYQFRVYDQQLPAALIMSIFNDPLAMYRRRRQTVGKFPSISFLSQERSKFRRINGRVFSRVN